MKNYQIKDENGNYYWVHRAISVASFIFKIENKKEYILANKRGIGTPNEQGKWNCPCGYLDWDETLKQAALREIYEECNLNIPSVLLGFIEFNDNPSENFQNVTARFLAILYPDKGHNTKISIGINGEENEVEEVKWIDIDTIDEYEWAFNHNNIIKNFLIK